ncbi:EAL domain-containing protein [Sphingomonas sp. KC8]|uniref:EAL domain-containing protein n=1 Tax=Sphingomonas sp. KC8 TaxID=1030157 RepID=UPI0002488F98|nr:EAL domain-containing protein [Sphingomonas sp. KC8]ARS29284.1 hypothetical protein KC8_18585 [Sphingomonas sp. KC8]
MRAPGGARSIWTGIARRAALAAGAALIHAGAGLHRLGRADGDAETVPALPAPDYEPHDRAQLEADLRRGISEDEIVPYYQPILALGTNELVGFESLARWRHPHRGIIDPDIFIPIAEDTGAINDLCFALLRQACGDIRRWPPHLTLSINVSPLQICDSELSLRLLQILYANGLAPGRLIVEITESALIANVAAARRTITSLRNAGIKVALDDFGTGYSSLHHLRELQFDRLKIDRSFTQALGTSAGDTIMRAIVDLGGGLGMPITAEGIETAEQAGTMDQLGCAYGQGFMYGRPMPAADALVHIAQAEQSAPRARAVG